ncbi:hypothetical protein TNCV_3678541 [Trichonephila clavipes]|nr:hypothetical protein TNCV_3678541 [Trichonephila clavipes]
MPIHQVPTDDDVSQVLIEPNALEQLVVIHPGMATELASLISGHDKPVEIYSKKSRPVVRRKWATTSVPFRCLGKGPTMSNQDFS